MEQTKIDRINALARKQRESGLSPEEKEEQKQLRQEYVQAVRTNLRSTLDNTIILDEKGNRIK